MLYLLNVCLYELYFVYIKKGIYTCLKNGQIRMIFHKGLKKARSGILLQDKVLERI